MFSSLRLAGLSGAGDAAAGACASPDTEATEPPNDAAGC
ncbi:hypothetical protein ANO14919_110480 [Xylariales sp. No.14919]|nr:hypothetical protein ANO14919_110480 [Xylariales sp. No.14919]